MEELLIVLVLTVAGAALLLGKAMLSGMESAAEAEANDEIGNDGLRNN